MTTAAQLPRQLELNVNALCRAFRQALRHALKHDALGAPETSLAWQTVLARQQMVIAMLQAVGEFLNPAASTERSPSAASAEPVSISNHISPDAGDGVPPSGVDTTNEAPSDEEFLASLPLDIQEMHHQVVAQRDLPVKTRAERRRRDREIMRLQARLERRYRQWEEEQALSSPGCT